MAKKVLQVIESGYRATLEEQDDTVVWITHAMKGAGGDFDVLLRGHAVNYAVRGQDASGLAFGAKKQTQPPRIADDVAKFASKGINVYVVREDLGDRGIEGSDIIDGMKLVPRADVPKLFDDYQQVWHW